MLKKKLFVFVFIVVFILSGCAGRELAGESQGVSNNPQNTFPITTRQEDSQNAPPDAGQAAAGSGNASAIVDTNQRTCYDDSQLIDCPSEGAVFYGQDAQYLSNAPAYVDNGDGTVTDLNTGLMWQQDPGEKTNFSEAVAGADSFNLAGYTDWRLPTIKELYTLIDFTGTDVSREASSSNAAGLKPFIDTDYFVFTYGDVTGGRIIDSQWVSSTIYTSTVMGGQECFFGVNFADGRIKCYPTRERQDGGYYTIYVRGNAYGVNAFVDHGDGTITDRSSGLMWMQNDSGQSMDWSDALVYCESMELAGYSDWRLPDIKELQYIVDYTRSPDATNSPAIDPIFNSTPIINEAGQPDYGYYWSNTSHLTYGYNGSITAAYIAFGRGLGYMEEFGGYTDVHGAGSQRTDPKTGDGQSSIMGPQGDVRRSFNYVRCVRGGTQPQTDTGSGETPDAPPNDGGGQLPPGGDGSLPPSGDKGKGGPPPRPGG